MPFHRSFNRVRRAFAPAGRLLCAPACALAVSCGAGAPNAPARAESAPDTLPLREVRTTAAREEPWERTLAAYGSLVADERTALSAKVPGRLKSISIDLGTALQAGDVVAELDATDYELRLRNAEATLQQARTRLGLPLAGDDDIVDPARTGMVRQAEALFDEVKQNRDRVLALREQRVASQAEVDAAEAAYRVAESRLQDAQEEIQNRIAEAVQRRAELAIARQQLADTRIVAPFTGVILERRAGRGDYLAAGAALGTILRVDPLRLRVEVPERQSGDVRLGQTVRFFVEGDPNVYSGTVARTSPAISLENRTLLVEALVANPGVGAGQSSVGADQSSVGAQQGLADVERSSTSAERSSAGDGQTLVDPGRRLMRAGPTLRPGAFARAEIVIDRDAQALTVPREAIVSFAGIDKVLVVQDGKAVERRVKLGRRDAARVEVLSGLEPGEEVVLAPGDLQSGAPVRAAR